MATYYKAGSWNVICAVCGRQFKADEVRKRWDGVMVCHSDYESRHILDFIRAVPERNTVLFTSTEPSDVFIELKCPYPAEAGKADLGTADCAVADNSLISPEVSPPPAPTPPPLHGKVFGAQFTGSAAVFGRQVK